MNRLLLPVTAAVFALSGCASTEPPTFEQETNDIYVWDDSKSNALNWADIARDKHGIRDAKNAEDAQDLVSEAESAGWTLFSFATGGASFGLGMGALFGEIEDNQSWWPTYILLTNEQDVTNPAVVLSEVEKQLAPMFHKSNALDFKGVVWRSMGRNWANASLLVGGRDCKSENHMNYDRESERYIDLPVGYNRCVIDVLINVRPSAKMSSGDVYNIITVEQRYMVHIALSLAALYDGPTLFPSNYGIKLGSQETVIPFPFVMDDYEALLFTPTDISLPLQISN